MPTKTSGAVSRMAWSWSLAPGSSESTPLVHDGVMFVQGANDKVQALDARTGDLLWQYDRRLPDGIAGSFKRGLGFKRPCGFAVFRPALLQAVMAS